jgi:hypothetical protein
MNNKIPWIALVIVSVFACSSGGAGDGGGDDYKGWEAPELVYASTAGREEGVYISPDGNTLYYIYTDVMFFWSDREDGNHADDVVEKDIFFSTNLERGIDSAYWNQPQWTDPATTCRPSSLAKPTGSTSIMKRLPITGTTPSSIRRL